MSLKEILVAIALIVIFIFAGFMLINAGNEQNDATGVTQSIGGTFVWAGFAGAFLLVLLIVVWLIKEFH